MTSKFFFLYYNKIIFNIIICSVFPPLKKLEYLSISYMTRLHKVGKGSLSGLTGLKRLVCSNNPHLSEIDPNAISRPGSDDKATEEWPVIKEVHTLFSTIII